MGFKKKKKKEEIQLLPMAMIYWGDLALRRGE